VIRRAFTLVELLVSIVLVLILIAGVSRVFKITSETVGTTNMFAEKTRDMRAAQTAFINDFSNAVVDDAPFFIIDSQRTYAFRNRADMDADIPPPNSPPDPKTYDPAGTGTEVLVDPTEVSVRSHRSDILRFFSRGLNRRQTGDDGDYVDVDPRASLSSETVITYGHLRFHDGKPFPISSTAPLNDGDFRAPGPFGGDLTGTDPNTNNFFATDWALGRSQLLLENTSNLAQNRIIRQAPPDPQPPELNGQTAPTFSISPVHADSQSTRFSTGTPPPAYSAMSGRYDLGDGSMYDVWSAVSRYADYNVYPGHVGVANWWDRMSYRFYGDRYPTKPISSLEAALNSPTFLAGCTQFIVEFAGDFGNQVTGGLPTVGSDGVIDYIQDSNGTRRIRWYGFPRDVASNANDPRFKGGPDGKIDKNWDVVPLRDVLGQKADCEKYLPTTNAPANYVGALSKLNLTEKVGNDVAARYMVAFGPREMEKSSRFKPLMLRITIVLDDASDKLTQGQTYEYIFKLGL
jgi:prepilin-type N-terminal cleavage/methylation domain-containing protein